MNNEINNINHNVNNYEQQNQQPMVNTIENTTTTQPQLIKKQKNLKLIFGLIGVICLIIAIVFIILNVSSNKENKTDNKESITENKPMEGTAKLVLTDEKRINGIDSKFASNYFYLVEPNFQETIIDKNGKKLFTAKYYRFLSSRYVLYNSEENDVETENRIYDLEKNKVVFTFDNTTMFGNDELSVGLKDNTLFYHLSDNNKTYIVAHDLQKNKELWRTEAEMFVDNKSIENLGVKNKFLLVSAGNYLSKDNFKTIYASSILGLDGKFIIKGNTEDAENYRTDSQKAENLSFTYATATGNYIVTKENDYVETYDINGNKLSTISLKEENYNLRVSKVFENGTFIVDKYNKENFEDNIHILYNIKGDVLLTSELGNISTTGTYTVSEIKSSNVSSLSVGNKIIILKNNEIIKEYTSYKNEKYTGLTISSVEDENNFLIVSYYDESNEYIKKILNLNTLEEIDIPLEILNLEDFYESPNGEYIVFNNESTYNKDQVINRVYDKNMKLLYESSNQIYPIDDNFIIEDMGDTISIVNVTTKDKKEIEIKGEFGSIVNQAGFVTSDETNNYLYTFK